MDLLSFHHSFVLIHHVLNLLNLVHHSILLNLLSNVNLTFSFPRHVSVLFSFSIDLIALQLCCTASPSLSFLLPSSNFSPFSTSLSSSFLSFLCSLCRRLLHPFFPSSSFPFLSHSSLPFLLRLSPLLILLSLVLPAQRVYVACSCAAAGHCLAATYPPFLWRECFTRRHHIVSIPWPFRAVQPITRDQLLGVLVVASSDSDPRAVQEHDLLMHTIENSFSRNDSDHLLGHLSFHSMCLTQTPLTIPMLDHLNLVVHLYLMLLLRQLVT